jgi:glyoxylase-like metal-dependent hydrolase (beta-lactamase superfamily II)
MNRRAAGVLACVEAAVDAASNPRTGEPRSGLRFARIRTVGLCVNEWLHKEGAAILAHGNTRKRLAAAQRVEDWGFNFPQSPPAAIPSEVFSRDKILKANGTTPALKHYGPAHTDGDISVALQEPDVLHTGDTYWNGFYPFIDYSTGGSIDGTIRAADANFAAVGDGTIVIPGHGPPASNKAELKRYRGMLIAVRERVAAIKRQGLSLDETMARRPTAEFDAKWGRFAVGPALFTKLVYAGV